MTGMKWDTKEWLQYISLQKTMPRMSTFSHMVTDDFNSLGCASYLRSFKISAVTSANEIQWPGFIQETSRLHKWKLRPASGISKGVNHNNFYSLGKFSWNWGKYVECTIDRDIWSACFPNMNKLCIPFGSISYILNYLIAHMLPLCINSLAFHADPFPTTVPRLWVIYWLCLVMAFTDHFSVLHSGGSYSTF